MNAGSGDGSERRSGSDRRTGRDRRSGGDRRKTDRRVAEDRRDAPGGHRWVTSTATSEGATVRVDMRRRPAEKSRLETVARGYLVLEGAMPGEERLPLVGAATVVGRKGTDIEIDDSALSRRHFQIESGAGEFFIRDLDSSNGTFVNGKRIGLQRLSPSDKIEAGDTKFTFSVLEVIPWDRSD